MKNIPSTIIVICSIAIAGTINFHLGKYYERSNNKDNDHKVCTKAIELKANEADSLSLELAQCKGVYRELNNGQKYIKP